MQRSFSIRKLELRGHPHNGNSRHFINSRSSFDKIKEFAQECAHRIIYRFRATATPSRSGMIVVNSPGL